MHMLQPPADVFNVELYWSGWLSSCPVTKHSMMQVLKAEKVDVSNEAPGSLKMEADGIN